MKTAINSPCIILVRPQMGGNIGAAARAMLNFGLTNLRLVAPRDGWPNPAATDNSAGALDLMPEVQVFETLAGALADLHFVAATTARPRDMIKPVFSPQAAIDECRNRTGNHQKCGIVFGPERTGLENDELALCQAIINIPTNPDFSSLNLGQSVLLLAHEWFNTQANMKDRVLDAGDSFPAPQQKLEELFGRLESELENARFFRDEGLKPTMTRNIRNMFIRADLTDQEVRTFQGIISALIGRKKQ